MLNNNIKKLFDILTTNNWTISFIESASGGRLSSLITQIDGASKVFLGGLVTYSNYAKEKIANIDNQIIEKYGAVSYQTAFYMVKNTQELFKSDFCISITGNASENTMMENKKSCLYYVGIYLMNKINVYEVSLKPLNNRINNIDQISFWAINKLIDLINELKK